MRLVSRLCFALVLVTLLAGCFGGVRKQINPPRASIQELAAQPNGQWRITIRLQNFSNIPTSFDTVTARLTVAGQDAGAVVFSPALNIGPESADVFTTTITPPLAAKATVASALASRQAVRYTLTGKIATHDPRREDGFSYESVLNPAPGLNGVLR